MTALSIQACGMSSAIGLNAASSCAALRARLDNFQETRFISRDGDWILGAEVPLPQPWRGVSRMVQLIAGPVRECVMEAHGHAGSIPILLCLPEKARAGRFDRLEEQVWEGLDTELGHPHHKASRSYAYGQVGGVVALSDARKMIANGTPEVIIAGVDSFLIAETLRGLSAQDRLLTESNSNGFIAGEAGAAVLLSSSETGLCLRGIGFGAEDATISSGKPLRAEGLVKAIRDALEEAELTYEDISYRLADLSGEQYYFREATLAQTRLWRGKRDPEEVWHPCDGMGNTGAAVIPLCLGVGLTASRKGYAPGPVVMIHASHDDGRRAAMILEGAS